MGFCLLTSAATVQILCGQEGPARGVEVPAQPLALPRARVPRDHRRSILADRRIIHLRFDGVLGHERRLLDHLL